MSRVLSSRGLCVGLIIRPEECDVSECDREASIMRPWPTRGCCAMGKISHYTVSWKSTGDINILTAISFYLHDTFTCIGPEIL